MVCQELWLSQRELQIRSSATNTDGEVLKVFKSEVRGSLCVVSELVRMTERDSVMRRLPKSPAVWEMECWLAGAVTKPCVTFLLVCFKISRIQSSSFCNEFDSLFLTFRWYILFHLSPKTSFGVGIFTHILQMGEPSLLKP